MKEKLNITLIQPDILWGEINANISMFSEKINDLEGATDMIVLPEMFSTGFITKPQGLAEEMEGYTMQWMALTAKEKNCIITGSIIISESNKYYNRLIWMRPDGTWDFYDKAHLFRMLDESVYFTKGTKRVIIDLHGWKVLPLICYDLRFPVWSRNRGDYDIMLCTANWPESRRNVWEILLHARALENQAYVIGVNRTGKDGNDIFYTGDSVVIDPKGEIILKALPGKDTVETVLISYNELSDIRRNFPVHKDADDFELK